MIEIEEIQFNTTTDNKLPKQGNTIPAIQTKNPLDDDGLILIKKQSSREKINYWGETKITLETQTETDRRLHKDNIVNKEGKDIDNTNDFDISFNINTNKKDKESNQEIENEIKEQIIFNKINNIKEKEKLDALTMANSLSKDQNKEIIANPPVASDDEDDEDEKKDEVISIWVRRGISLVLFVALFVIANVYQDIRTIFSLLGATNANLTSYIFPSIFFIYYRKSQLLNW